MPGTPRECIEARASDLGSVLVNVFECRHVLGVAVVAEDRGLLGEIGKPVLPARLELGAIEGTVLELQETWSYIEGSRKLLRLGYRYAVFLDGVNPERDEPTYRFEHQPFGDAGRAQTVYGRDGIEHMHAEIGFGSDARIPTHRLSAEDVLRFVAAESSLGDPEAAVAVNKTYEAERDSADWTIVPAVRIHESEVYLSRALSRTATEALN